MTSTDLQFDKMEVNTDLAKKYFERNNYQLYCNEPYQEGTVVDFKVANCKILGPVYGTTECDESLRSLMCYKYIELSNKLHENMDLICQLEYLIRQIPLQTTKLELNMVIKKLRYQTIPEEKCVTKRLLMKNDSPLINLGCISMTPTLDIVASKKTAILCHLFVTLLNDCCRECEPSFRNTAVGVTFVQNFGDLTCSFIKSKVLSSGCVGVVTAQSDVDSAVAKLLSAQQGDIWGVRHILVQESAIDRFKKAIVWKSRGSTDVDTELKSRCTDFYVYDGKIYLYEYVGNQSGQNIVNIVAFRTVKELMSLIECYSPFCLSLWSSDVAESNEIALDVAAPLVWVNDYGVLGETSQISQAYYSYISNTVRNPKLDLAYSEVCELQKDWAKLTTVQRRDKTLGALEAYFADRKITRKLCFESESTSKNFANVTTNSVVLGINKPRSVYTVRWSLEDAAVKDFVARLIDGSGFLVSYPEGELLIDNKVTNDTVHAALPTYLLRSDFPIRIIDSEGEFDSFPLAHTTRVIYTSYGTIFAN